MVPTSAAPLLFLINVLFGIVLGIGVGGLTCLVLWRPWGSQDRPHGCRTCYDGDGLRVEKSSGTLYWRSYSGQVVEETNTSGNMQRDYIFFAGRRIAWRNSSGNVYYYFADALGSTRTVTNATGSTCFDADYYPYGQENDFNTSCSPTYKFTGYEYDSETGNYYAYARYYDPRIGRFMTTDPLGGDASNPQSLNRYSYVLNNPESLVDGLGMMPTGNPPLQCFGWGTEYDTYESWDNGQTWMNVDSWIDWNGFVCPAFPNPTWPSGGGGGGGSGGGCIIGPCGAPNLPIPPAEQRLPRRDIKCAQRP
jgi:RHS repeat-associated protein